MRFPFLHLQTRQANLTHLPRSQYVPGIGLGIGKCPYDPADNSTAVYVENGNPFGLPALVSPSLTRVSRNADGKKNKSKEKSTKKREKCQL